MNRNKIKMRLNNNTAKEDKITSHVIKNKVTLYTRRYNTSLADEYAYESTRSFNNIFKITISSY